MAERTITITIEDARLIRHWYLPSNPNKIRRPRDMKQRREVQTACRRFLAELANAGIADAIAQMEGDQ